MAVNLKIKNQQRKKEYVNTIDMPIRKTHKFVDLKLDIEQSKVGKPLFYDQNIVNGTDISVATDEHAVAAYLKNLFSCSPGDLYLNPEFGINLRQFIFDPVTEITARNIGAHIDNSIKDSAFFGYESNVIEIEKIFINPDIERGLFEIALILHIIPLSKKIKLFGDISPSVGVLFYTK